jgi:hypothetical protein
MDNYSAGGVGASIIAVAVIIYNALNHKRIISTCCGRRWTASVDVEETTPKIEVPKSQPEDT